MSRPTFHQLSFIAKLAVLWLVLLVLPLVERTLLCAESYYFLYIGLGLVFVMYGLTIRSIFFFLQHTGREPVHVGLRSCCGRFLLNFYLPRAGSLRSRVRSSAPHVRGIDYA
jgi:hypothetical protein